MGPSDGPGATTLSVQKATTADLTGLSDDALIWKDELARRLGCSTRTVDRMVQRGELPASIRLRGGSAWRVGSVRRHWAEMQARAIAEWERDRMRFEAAGA
jgi:excisionase family DNA binding protein